MKKRKNLLNTGLALEPPDILHNLIDVISRRALDLRHVAKFPMVRLDAVGRSPLKRGIAMMVRLIDLMHQRRSMVGPRRLFPMTGCAVGGELRLTDLEFHWYRGPSNRLLGLRGIAGYEKAHEEQPHSNMRP